MTRARNRWAEPGRGVYRSSRWRAVRLEALRRDGFACVQCGVRGRLEVDHVVPVREAPDRAFDLSNLQVLCGGCHSAKTRVETGRAPVSPERREWRALLRMQRNPSHGVGHA